MRLHIINPMTPNLDVLQGKTFIGSKHCATQVDAAICVCETYDGTKGGLRLCSQREVCVRVHENCTLKPVTPQETPTESSIAVFPMRMSAYELLPTVYIWKRKLTLGYTLLVLVAKNCCEPSIHKWIHKQVLARLNWPGKNAL